MATTNTDDVKQLDQLHALFCLQFKSTVNSHPRCGFPDAQPASSEAEHRRTVKNGKSIQHYADGVSCRSGRAGPGERRHRARQPLRDRLRCLRPD